MVSNRIFLFQGSIFRGYVVSRRVFPTIGEKSHWRKMEKKGRKKQAITFKS